MSLSERISKVDATVASFNLKDDDIDVKISKLMETTLVNDYLASKVDKKADPQTYTLKTYPPESKNANGLKTRETALSSRIGVVAHNIYDAIRLFNVFCIKHRSHDIFEYSRAILNLCHKCISDGSPLTFEMIIEGQVAELALSSDIEGVHMI
jgi:hypothetical protein